ncbi:TPA: Jag N-terminal domain-containing protein [Campylobacter jejuni]|nr:Jag N-terminal domain-containing protein [Campylobacter jejuni]
MKIEAIDLQSALTEASRSLECSVMDLEYEIIQHPRKGFFGFGRKKAIIEAKAKKRILKKNPKKEFTSSKNHKPETHEPKQESKIETKNEKNKSQKEKYTVKSDEIFDSFHRESKGVRNTQDILDEIRIQLVKLLESSQFKIELSELRMYDEDCVLIRLDGEDAALMIGKEAHRYKAISYLLHNWINLKYNLLVRLEIAQFLENQIQGMQLYLQNVIEKIKIHGRGQTKPLDGVLIKIALEQLRAEFPDKYVGIKQNNDQRFVVINDFFKKDE